MTASPRLLTIELAVICLVAFVCSCNLTIYYNLFTYLETIGIPIELRGVVIGAYAFTAMLLYLFASPFVNAGNATRVIMLGMVVMIACGWSYLFISSFRGLVAVRMLNGAGNFLAGAGVMAFFVTVIPAARIGQAFAIYTVAVLLPFGLMPAVVDMLSPFIPTPPHGYAAATLPLLPAGWLAWRVGRESQRRRGSTGERKERPAWAVIRANVTRLPIGLLLFLNLSYFMNWSSVFFFFKGFALQQGMAGTGLFFIIQMVVMVSFRILAGRLFDTLDKVILVAASFALAALGYLTLDRLTGGWAVSLAAVLFGLGNGMSYPALYGLMFNVSAPPFRPLNANLILCTMQAGYFLGPVLGGALVTVGGYHGFFLGGTALMLAGIILSACLALLLRRAAAGTGSS